MRIVWLALFCISAVLVAYVYFGYPAALLVLSRLKRAPRIVPADGFEPSVSIIIPAHNEENVIEDKIENSLSLDYPMDKLEIVVGSDGSIDRTEEIVRRYEPKVVLVRSETQIGKASILNKAVQKALGEILLFTDANVMLQQDAIRRSVRHFADSEVGCVVGRVTYWNESESTVTRGESLYWRYELFLRKRESEIGNLAMGSGPIMAITASLFQSLDANISEDFVLPLQVVRAGFRCIYEPEAVSKERLYQATPRQMFQSKARIVSLDLRGLFLNRDLLNPLHHPLVSWGLISHKLLRWLVPYILIALLAFNLLLLSWPFSWFIMALQVAFYTLALLGYLWQKKGTPHASWVSHSLSAWSTWRL